MNCLDREAFFVGGCVRNALLHQTVADIDIATPLVPDEVIRRADAAGLKVVPTGLSHGTMTLISHGKPFEVTTFRKDIDTNGRHAIVAFSTTMSEDAARRDFTLNALYADSSGMVIDPLGTGLDDLSAGRVRFIL
ncbi:MAG: CCA tRNA nucleotidyltransferase, partial [Pseudomonadota bacterium]